MRKTNKYETLLKNNNEYFEYSFTVNEIFQKFIFWEISDDEMEHRKTRVEMFPLPF